MSDEVPDYAPDMWAMKSSYPNVPIVADGPVSRWADELLGSYGYRWAQVTEWRWVSGEIAYAQFVCRSADGGREWVTVLYAKAPPTPIEQHKFERLL